MPGLLGRCDFPVQPGISDTDSQAVTNPGGTQCLHHPDIYFYWISSVSHYTPLSGLEEKCDICGPCIERTQFHIEVSKEKKSGTAHPHPTPCPGFTAGISVSTTTTSRFVFWFFFFAFLPYQFKFVLISYLKSAQFGGTNFHQNMNCHLRNTNVCFITWTPCKKWVELLQANITHRQPIQTEESCHSLGLNIKSVTTKKLCLEH